MIDKIATRLAQFAALLLLFTVNLFAWVVHPILGGLVAWFSVMVALIVGAETPNDPA